MEQSTIIYFSFVWLTAAWAGVSRSVRNGDWKSSTHCASVFCVSGFLGFAVVALTTDYRQSDFNGIYGLGIAAVVGLAGREQTELISILWRKALGMLSGGTVPDRSVAGDPLGDSDRNGDVSNATLKNSNSSESLK